MRAAWLITALAISTTAKAAPYVPFVDPALDRNISDLDYVLEQRRLTLYEGGTELHASFDNAHVDGLDEVSTIAVSAAHGVSDTVELGVATVFLIRPEARWGRYLVPRATVALVEGDYADLGFDVDVIVHFGDDPLERVRVGVPSRFRVGGITLLAGHNLIELYPPEDELFVAANVAIGVGVTERIALRLDTQLARFAIAGAGATFIGLDFVPVALGFFYDTSPSQDFNVALSFPDVSLGFDFFAVSVNSLSRF